MNWNPRNALVGGLCLLVLVIVAWLRPREISDRDSFSRKDNIAWGCELLFEQLDTLFDNPSVEIGTESLYSSLNDSTPADLYILINKNLYLNPEDRVILLEHIYEGAVAFLAAEDLDYILLDSLDLSKEYLDHFNIFNMDADSVWRSPMLRYGMPHHIMTEDTMGQTYQLRSISYPYRLVHVDSTREPTFEALGYWSDPSDLNYVAVPYGEGMVFLHLNPYTFTNYHVVDSLTRVYTALALSFLPTAERIYWDEYYKVGRSDSPKGSLSILMEYRGTRIAWRALMILLLLYAITQAKRRQKAIPIVKPPSNLSIQYAKTVGNLYFQHGSNSEVFSQREFFFRDYCQNKYGFQIRDYSEQTAVLFSQKTAFPADKTQQLFRLLKNMSGQESISRGQIQAVSKRINEFYRH